MTEGQQTTVRFGNAKPQMQVKVPHGDSYKQISIDAPHINQSVTTVSMWPGFDDPEAVAHTLSTDNDRFLVMVARSLDAQHQRYAVGVSELEQVVAVHSPSCPPMWIDSNDREFAVVLAKHFGCPAGEPVALQTTVGRDAMIAQHASTSAQPAAFNYLALADSASTTTPAAGNTTLAGEITTVGGGLIRAQATYAHTTSTNTATLTKTFTANGTDTLPVTVSQDGVFNAVTSGTLGYKDALNANSTLTISGDNVTVTHTLTIG